MSNRRGMKRARLSDYQASTVRNTILRCVYLGFKCAKVLLLFFVSHSTVEGLEGRLQW